MNDSRYVSAITSNVFEIVYLPSDSELDEIGKLATFICQGRHELDDSGLEAFEFEYESCKHCCECSELAARIFAFQKGAWV